VKNAKPLDIETFLAQAVTTPVFDVRTAAEHKQGRIPGAFSLPIFDEAERAAIGTAYKTQSREDAVLLGFDFFGKKMRSLTEFALSVAPQNALVHCWRGGMRSEAMAWMLNFYGIKTYILEGGYKAFRRYTIASFDIPHRIVIVGGYTGTGKTAILTALRDLGEQVIDLEAVARHKGSAFGAIGMLPQQSNEQFENELGLLWRKLDSSRRVWLEDESQKIGGAFIPQPIYDAIRSAPALQVDAPIELRIAGLIAEYGNAPAEQIAAGIRKIERRLGGYHTKLALDAIAGGDLASCFRYILHYYDRAYDYGLASRNSEITRKIAASDDIQANARVLLQYADSFGW